MIKRTIIPLIMIALFSWGQTAFAGEVYQYQLYKNSENFGILVFPKKLSYKEVEDMVKSLGFEEAESGEAVMRYGSKKENATYMMPKEVQEKHKMKKFVVLQVLTDQSLLSGIYDPEWGLTLPSAIFQLDEVRERIKSSLNIFRGGSNNKKEASGNFSPPDLLMTSRNNQQGD